MARPTQGGRLLIPIQLIRDTEPIPKTDYSGAIEEEEEAGEAASLHSSVPPGEDAMASEVRGVPQLEESS